MSVKIKISEDTLALFQNGTKVNFDGVEYMYFPFWLKETNEKLEFEVLGLDELPKDFVDFVNKGRETDNGKPQ